MLLINVDMEEILVNKIIWEDKKLEERISRKLLTGPDDFYLSRSTLKSPNKNICFDDSFVQIISTNTDSNLPGTHIFSAAVGLYDNVIDINKCISYWIIWELNIYRVNIGTNRLTYSYLQTSALNWMNKLLISNIYFKEQCCK